MSESKPPELETLRELATRLTLSTNALAVLGLAVNQRITGTKNDPLIQPYIDDVVESLGVKSIVENANAPQLIPILAEICACVFQSAKIISFGPKTSGWTHTEKEFLQYSGQISMSFPPILKQRIVSQLAGLAERLDSGDAQFLDVGVGVAAMAIEMARLWPSLRITGIDPWKPSLALAKQNVRRAGLEDRIELREQKGEDITDSNTFDLAWIPSAFIPCSSIEQVVNRVHTALRPGGWVLFAMAKAGGDPLRSALVRLRTIQWGGCLMSADEVESLLRSTGFSDIKTLPTPPNALVALTTARKAGTV
jgi:precorrin-6B methylase 2